MTTETDFSCLICYEDIVDGFYTTLCGHVYHLGCARTWITLHETCPTCRHRTLFSPHAGSRKVAEDNIYSEFWGFSAYQQPLS
jgi:hypothetical protein